MLKLTYTETSFHLESIAQSLEDWVQARVRLALRVGQSFCVEPSTASFLLPNYLLGIEQLQTELRFPDSENLSLAVCDTEYIEVILRGAWLTSGCNEDMGVFVTAMREKTELFLYKLWQEAQVCQEVRSF
ncbi:alr0857 family protein [Calothrix sp. NIES-3974]|uniref:alr0857 family protein n=1 Tax=Calothrix sp. NIES-3974 TaxID=2005462 RepID=UPI000B6064B9|nr:alr0857 family protein [Calothrix sp. NIES-3974]BAZ05400.1 hypothetical protein NIES3974_20480 [Calothrix sp. NIES-3974]